MTRPEITVIVPTRHRPQLLAATLLSLQCAAAEAYSQAAARVRLLVVDDAPDNEETRHLVAGMPGVDYARVAEHDGRADPGAAILLGLGRVDTEYHALFGDDDIALPRHFLLAGRLLQEGHDVVSNSFHYADAELKRIGDKILERTTLLDLVEGRTGLNDGSFVRTDLFAEAPKDVSLEAHMLLPAWAWIMMNGASFEIITEPTFLYRRHDGNISRSALTARDLELRRRAKEAVLEQLLSRHDLLTRLYGAAGRGDD